MGMRRHLKGAGGAVEHRRRTRRTGLVVVAIAAAPLLMVGQSAVAGAAPSAASKPSAAAAPLTAALAAQLSKNVNRHVIVVMKDQLPAAPVGSPAATSRAHAVASDQASVMSELRQVHATNIKAYQLVNSFAATVSAGEAARLKVNPGVAEVVPDVTIHLAAPTPASTATTTTAVAAKTAAGTSLTPNVMPRACGPNGQVQLDPEGLELTHTDSADPKAPTARSLGITGAGVKVAWIADGIDPNNVNFIRPDGTSVFDPATGGDYQDFTGDGPGQAHQRRRGVPRRQHDRRPGHPRLQRQRLLRPAGPVRVQHPHRGCRAGRQPGRAQCLRLLRGHHGVQLPAGDQLCRRDRPRQRDQRVVRLEPVP